MQRILSSASGILVGTVVGTASALAFFLYFWPKSKNKDPELLRLPKTTSSSNTRSYSDKTVGKTKSPATNCVTPTNTSNCEMAASNSNNHSPDNVHAANGIPNNRNSLSPNQHTSKQHQSDTSNSDDSIEELLSKHLVVTDAHPGPSSPGTHSQASTNDSGKGPSPHDSSNTAGGPVPGSDVNLTQPRVTSPCYDFEVPKEIVGLLIGTKGVTVKKLMDESGAYIIIRPHLFSEKHKICSIEGTRQHINACLRQIRRRFPPSRFPELKLTPFIPPPLLPSAPGAPPGVAPGLPMGMTPSTIVQLSIPSGVRVEVLVSSIVTPTHLFLQQPTHPTYPSLARLDQYMLAVYGQPVGAPVLPRPFDVNIVCVAPVLGGWYRAQIMEIFSDTDEVLLRFVDYGGYGRASGSDLRQIRSDFMTLPFQAVECYLAHIEPKDGSGVWSSESLSFVEKQTSGQVVEAAVVGVSAIDKIPIVEVYATSGGKVSYYLRFWCLVE